jgi:hypothetical protein
MFKSKVGGFENRRADEWIGGEGVGEEKRL